VADPKAKRFEHDVELRRDGRFGADGETVDMPENWTPEDSVLAGLLDCSLTSLRYHALRYGVAVDAEGSAHGEITKRPDGRYGFVLIDVHFNVSLAPRPTDQEAAELFAKAERDCFVGASLVPPPTYTWTIVE
jgi:uncharacterized OsmC-like protein